MSTPITDSPLFSALSSALGPDYHLGPYEMGGVALCDKRGNAMAIILTGTYSWREADVVSIDFLPPSCTIVAGTSDDVLRLAQHQTWRDERAAQLRYTQFRNFDGNDLRRVFDALNAHVRYHHGSETFPFPPGESEGKEETARFMIAPALDDEPVLDRTPYQPLVDAINEQLRDEFAIVVIPYGWAIARRNLLYGELKPTEGGKDGALMAVLFREPQNIDKPRYRSWVCPRMILPAVSDRDEAIADASRFAAWAHTQTTLLWPGEQLVK